MRTFGTSSLVILSAVSLMCKDASAACLSASAATTVANNYATLFSNYSTSFANKVLATSFSDQSDSVISLINNGTTCPDTVRRLPWPHVLCAFTDDSICSNSSVARPSPLDPASRPQWHRNQTFLSKSSIPLTAAPQYAINPVPIGRPPSSLTP